MMDFPGAAEGDFENATIYVRPHLLDVDRQPKGTDCFRARVVHINPAGPVVKVELRSEWGETLQAELTLERYSALNLKKSEEVFVALKKNPITLWENEEEQ
jgi:sulfate transport system ATP-binding protein